MADPVYREKAAPSEAEDLPIAQLRLKDLAHSDRFYALDKMEAYYRSSQYNHLRYNWDGNFQGYGGEADISPGWFVPMKHRQPAATIDLSRIIVSRFTGLLFGRDRWPEITVEGDKDAEDYAKALVRVSKLQSKLIEARNLGGSQGTACLSFGFVNGRPQVQGHNSKHITVLGWADPERLRPSKAIECYGYKRRVYEGGKMKDKNFYYARYWDQMREIIWDPIPDEVASQETWVGYSHRQVLHGYGFCPFYWIQNLPDSYQADGESDYHGQCDNIDELNRLFSAASRGTIASVEPTLVVHMDPTMNDGTVRKGVGNAIFSPGGAKYLEVSGSAVNSAATMAGLLKQGILDACQCIVPDPDKVAGSQAMSGEAMRLLYAPMLSKCDLMREQYGNGLIDIVTDMLNAARSIDNRPQEPITLPDGEVVVPVQRLDLPPKVETETVEGEDGKKEVKERTVRLNPGTSDNVELNWGPYFAHTWGDIEAGLRAAREGIGNRPVLSHKTAIKMVSSMTGVRDVEAEMNAIDEDQEMAVERAQRAFAEQGEGEENNEPPKPGQPPKPGEKKPEKED